MFQLLTLEFFCKIQWADIIVLCCMVLIPWHTLMTLWRQSLSEWHDELGTKDRINDLISTGYNNYVYETGKRMIKGMKI